MKIYFEEKLAENAARPKELRRKLKLLELPNNKIPPSDIYLKSKNGLSFVSLSIAKKEIVLFTCGNSCCKTTKTIK